MTQKDDPSTVKPFFDPNDPAAQKWREERRAAREKELGEEDGPDRSGIPRMDVAAWVSQHAEDSPMIAAIRALKDPQRAAAVERQMAEEREATREQIQTMARRNRFNRYKANRPTLFASASYADLDLNDKSHVKVARWWRGGSKTLVLVGEPGRGKTHGAYAICNEVAADDRDGRTGVPVVVRAHLASGLRDLLQPVGPHLARDEVASGHRARDVNELYSADLLLIDDLSAANVTDWFREQMHKLIDYRVSNDQRTIVTLNAGSKQTLGQEMVERFGAAIVSRLRDDAVFVWLEGVDRRGFAKWDPFADE